MVEATTPLSLRGATKPRNGSGQTVRPSDLFRDRHIARFYNATTPLSHLPLILPSEDGSTRFVPQSSRDTALTAFAQLAALRLNVTRALISLIDSRYQYVLAEATRTLSIQNDDRHDPDDWLWLGSVVLPRSSGVCGLVMDKTTTEPLDEDEEEQIAITVLPNLQQHSRYASLPPFRQTKQLQFYAGVPLLLPDGTKIGVYCIFDNKPRAALSKAEKVFLRDMAKTTVDHLVAMRIKADHMRKNKLVDGLESFINGLTTSNTPEAPAGHRKPNSASSQQVPSKANATTNGTADSTRTVETTRPAPPKRGVTALWEQALPAGSRAMLYRAADVIRQSADYDGMAFFYLSSASSRANSSLGTTQTVGENTQSDHDSLDPPSHTNSEDSDNARNARDVDGGRSQSEGLPSPGSPCPVLSYSLGPEESRLNEPEGGAFRDFKLQDVDRLLGRHPRGRIFALDQNGQPFYGDTSSSGSSNEQHNPDSTSTHVSLPTNGAEDSRSRRHKTRIAQVRSLQKLSPRARSFACLPLWDFERRRWFAYGIAWLNSSHRDLVLDGDLHLLRIFGNSIMIALAHIDALAVNRTKTSFVSSVSHELRSPLHGMLAAAEFLQDSSLNRFQSEMVASILNSGRTLLDTVDHVMDFAKINSLAVSGNRTGPGSILDGRRIGQGRLGLPSAASVDLAVMLEEVLDIVTIGFSVQHDFLYPDENETASQHRVDDRRIDPKTLELESEALNRRAGVRIAVEVPYRSNWCVSTQAGGWRRVIMNLFSNALKYTAKGLVTVRLEPKQYEDSKSLSILLSVNDTGMGISNAFLENHLFQPFSQENSFASGTGLGLSIVDQVVRSMGGNIRIKSSEGTGTNIDVELTLPVAHQNPSQAGVQEFNMIVATAKQLKICILDEPPKADVRDAVDLASEAQFVAAIQNTLHEWFGMEVPIVKTWTPGSADLVIFTKPSFKQLEDIRRTVGDSPVPPVIIVASDALELVVLQADARISEGNPVVQIIAQPIGPRKLARAIEQCLQRGQKKLNNEVDDVPVPHRVKNALDKLPAPGQTDHIEHGPSSESVHLEAHTPKIDYTQAVLIVDDNKLNLRLLGAFLRKLSTRYYEAVNGLEALDMYKAANGAFRYVLMDISMPVMDGMTSTRRIREYEREAGLPRVPIIALTGLASTAARSEAQEAGMDDFLTKPVSFKMLKSSLPPMQEQPPAQTKAEELKPQEAQLAHAEVNGLRPEQEDQQEQQPEPHHPVEQPRTPSDDRAIENRLHDKPQVSEEQVTSGQPHPAEKAVEEEPGTRNQGSEQLPTLETQTDIT